MREYEAHFLDIDVEAIQDKLTKLGATKVFEGLLKETIFDTKDRSWNRIHKLLRLRTDGNYSTIAYKEQIKEDEMGGREELETTITDYENTRLILEQIGMMAVREQEKKRITYKLKDVVYDIDIWPKGKPYLEIESDNEDKVKQAAEQLGLNWKDVCLYDAKKILINIFGLKDFDNVKYFTFDKFEYHAEK